MFPPLCRHWQSSVCLPLLTSLPIDRCLERRSLPFKESINTRGQQRSSSDSSSTRSKTNHSFNTILRLNRTLSRDYVRPSKVHQRRRRRQIMHNAPTPPFIPSSWRISARSRRYSNPTSTSPSSDSCVFDPSRTKCHSSEWMRSRSSSPHSSGSVASWYSTR